MTTHPIPAAALDDRLGFVGLSGYGKTYAALESEERVLELGRRVIHVDPLGVAYGLRLMPNGKTPSRFNVVIFGGAHGDLPLNEFAGALIGETVAGMAESCIIDLSGIGTKAAERRFMLPFLTALYRCTTGEPVHLVLDEADMWAPQQVRDKEGEAVKLLGMVETIVRRGRVKGFIPWLISQRPAVVNKDILSQVDGLISFKLTSSQDRDALEGWIEGQADRAEWKAMRAALPTLDRGQAVVWIPGRSVLDTIKFPQRRTFDSSRTPKRGEVLHAAKLAPLDVGRLRERLSTVESEAKANDPKALKAEIADLKRQLAKAPAAQAAPDPQAIATAEQRGYEKGYHDGSEKILRAVGGLASDMAKSVAHAEESCASSKRLMESFSGFIETQADRRPRPPVSMPRQAPYKANGSHAPAPRSVAAPKGDGTLNGAQRRVINSLAFWNSVGDDTPTREQVAGVAGYSPGSGNFNNVLSSLRTMGAIEYPSGGRLRLVDPSLADGAMSRSEARDVLHGVFGGPQRKIVGILIESREGELTREEIAQRSDYSAGSGNFNNLLSSLRTLSVIDYPSKGYVALAPWARTVLAP